MILISFGVAIFFALTFWRLLKLRHMNIWFFSYLIFLLRRLFQVTPKDRHFYFCFADHYEPYGFGATQEQARKRVSQWLASYPTIAQNHRDSDGNLPKHSFFYPEEEYDPVILKWLEGFCAKGMGDVEVHLHHDHDTAQDLERKIVNFKKVLHSKHGFLRKDTSGNIIYGFIHGNWALDNSRPDGRWCGVDNELSLLKTTGCYADFTMPSAPSDTQTKKINSIYFAKGQPGKRKSHDRGVAVRVGYWDETALLMIQGPLMLNWKERKWGLMPKIESGEISFDAPPNACRIALWGKCAIAIKGAEEHIFIKVHTHGATEKSMKMLFGGGLEQLWTELEFQYRDTPGHFLHYVTAWEMVTKIRSLATTQQS